MKVPDPEREVEKIMKIVDLNNSGVIDYMGLNTFYFLLNVSQRVYYGYDQ